MRGLICLWIVALAPLLWGGEGKAGKAPSESATEFDFAAFGRLPVWYNGRVTDLSRVAENFALRLSGSSSLPSHGEQAPAAKGEAATKPVDPDSKRPDSALRWMLDVLTGGESWRTQPLILVEHESLRGPLALKADVPLPARLSVTVLQDTSALEAEYDRVLNAATPWTDENRQVLDLVDRLKGLRTMIEVLRLPDTSTRETAAAALQRDTELRQQAIPLLVPPRRNSEAWTSLTMALILRAFGEQVGAEENPAADKLLPILAAYGANDPGAFNRAVADYANYVEALKLDPSPWNMVVPAGWTELGVPPALEPAYFSDTRRVGATAAMLSRRQGNEQVTLRLNVFPSPIVTREDVINSWRLSSALAPQRLAEMPIEKIDVAGTSGWRVALEAPAGLAVTPTRMLGAVFRIDAGLEADGKADLSAPTWIVTCEGSPGLVASSAEVFDNFLASLRIGPAAQTAAWFGLSPAPSNPVIFEPGTGYVVAFIPTGDSMWVLRGPLFAQVDHEAKLEEFRRFLKSLRSRKPTDDDRLPFHWTDPPTWTRHTDPGGRRSVRTGSDEFLLSADVYSAGEGDISSMIRAWRGEFLLPEWSREDLAKAKSEFEWEGGTATLVTWRVPKEADGNAAAAGGLIDADGVGIAFGKEPPKNWEPARNAFAQAAFQIKDEDGAADVTVVALPGDGGGLEKNSARWRSQLVSSDKEADSIKVHSTKIKLQGLEVDRIELGGEGTKRTIVVAIPHAGRTWFIKLTGDAPLVERLRKDFDTFAQGIELRGGSPPGK